MPPSIGALQFAGGRRFPILRPCLLVLACAGAIPTQAQAQESWYAAIGGSYVLPVAGGRTDSCGRSHRLGTMQRVGRRVMGSTLAVEVNTRLGPFPGPSPGCVYLSPSEPPIDGTWLVEDRPLPFLESEWFAADLRLRATLPLRSPGISLGLGPGSHWQMPRGNGSSPRRPFWVASAGVLLGQGHGWRMGLEGEWQVMRERYDRNNVTYSGGVVTSTEPLGSVTEWLRTVSVSVFANFAW